MSFGYLGYYLCRSNFSVALPLIVDELVARGISPTVARIRLGTIASLGVAAYAIGKFPAGVLSDYLGGRNFLAGIFGLVLCILLFAVGGGLPVFTGLDRQPSGSVSGLEWSRSLRAGSLITAMAR
jgi:sugar phosphate permease